MRYSVFVVLGLIGCANPASEVGPGEHTILDRLSFGAWTENSPDAGARFGVVVATGDLDGDGKAEILVGAPWTDDPEIREGSVSIYAGSATPTPMAKLEIDDDRSRFGHAMAVADVDGDGTEDVLVGAPLFESSHAERDEGAVFLFRGLGGGTFSTTPDWSYEADQTGAMLGMAIANLGDLDSDGDDEFAIGAPGWDGATADCGKVMEFDGGATPTLLGEASQGVEGALEGWALVATQGFMGMPLPEVVAGAPGMGGRFEVYLTAASPQPSFFMGIQPSVAHQFGYSLAAAPDLDNDGFAEVVIGEPGARYAGQAGAGKVHIYSLQGDTLYGRGEAGARFGSSVAEGDFEGDGRSDLLVGAPRSTVTLAEQGAVYEYRNHGNIAGYTMDWMQAGVEAGARFGRSIAAGDVDGDGADDAVIGVPLVDGTTTHDGSVVMHRGVLDTDGDGVEASFDCDDTDAGVGGPTTWYLDGDFDGYGYSIIAQIACAQPLAFVDNGLDCDDNDPAVNPATAEICNYQDDNCDGFPDEDFSVGVGCTAGQGECAAAGTIQCDPGGLSATCDAVEGTPGVETCNGLDDDCDGTPDNGVGSTWFADLDADGYGDAGNSLVSCDQPYVYVADSSDCDDSDGTVFPGATEVCNGYDDNCDGTADEDGATGCLYPDDDGDGYGSGTCVCNPSGAAADNGDDCYEGNALANPGADPQVYYVTDRGDGSFDYDCSLLEESDRPMGYCDNGCVASLGWNGFIPACGQSANLLGSCTIAGCFGCLQVADGTAINACH